MVCTSAYVRNVVHPDTPQLRKISGTSIKIIHEMKGDRDGKSAKGVQQEYSAVVVNGIPVPTSFLT